MTENAVTTQVSTRPGGFWIRFLAAIVDGIIVAIPCAIVNAIFKSITATVSPGDMSSPFAVFSFVLSALIGYLFRSRTTPTIINRPGQRSEKSCLLKVIDNSTGNLLTFKQVFLREVIGKFLSSLTLMIGYIMAGVRHDKRALHDLVADTRVVESLGASIKGFHLHDFQ